MLNSEAVDLEFPLETAAPGELEAAPAVRRPLFSRNSPLFQALRWAYQPVKAIASGAADLRQRPSMRRTIAAYLAGSGFKGLHVGCGPFHLDGWLNSDLRPNPPHTDFSQDITRRFPLPDESLDAIYGCEVVEHLPRGGMVNFLRQSYRVLKSGGVLRLTTPDVNEVCRLFLGVHPDVKLEQFRAVWLEGNFSPEAWINSQFREWGHQHLYSFDELSKRLAHAGFRKVVRCQPHTTPSAIEQLGNLETRYGKSAPDWLWAKTMILEASR